MANELILLNCWASPYGVRVRVALAVKEIEYEYREEDLANKSALLQEMNPVYSKVPVLIHKGNPICESLIQIQYIDEVWNEIFPLLPSDPYEKSKALFWANYVDEKAFKIGKTIWAIKGEELEKAKKELLEIFKVLEKEIGDKTYFLGDTFGYVDVSLIPLYSWLFTFETCASFSVEEECPKLLAYFKRCVSNKKVADALPDQQDTFAFVKELRKIFGIE